MLYNTIPSVHWTFSSVHWTTIRNKLYNNNNNNNRPAMAHRQNIWVRLHEDRPNFFYFKKVFFSFDRLCSHYILYALHGYTDATWAKYKFYAFASIGPKNPSISRIKKKKKTEWRIYKSLWSSDKDRLWTKTRSVSRPNLDPKIHNTHFWSIPCK